MMSLGIRTEYSMAIAETQRHWTIPLSEVGARETEAVFLPEPAQVVASAVQPVSVRLQ